MSELVFPALNLLLLLAVLYTLARKPIRAWFGERRDRIQSDVEQAAALRDEAEQRYAQWQRQLAELDTEVERIRQTARERAEAEREQILADARASAQRVQDDARAAVDHELRRARAALRREASDLAVELAGGLLREQVTDEDRDRLVDEFIERIESGSGANGSGS